MLITCILGSYLSLLLDAMDIADPGLIERYFPPESPTRNTARELPPSTGPVPEHLSPDMNGGNSTPMTRSSRLSHTNGSSNNTNVQSNGVRHRLNEVCAVPSLQCDPANYFCMVVR